MSGIMDGIKKRRRGRRAFRFVTSVIESGNVNISFNPEQAKLIAGCDDSVESYDLYADKGDFFTGAPKTFHDIAVVSVVKIDGAFFTDFALEFNHKEIDVPNRKARWLYDQAQTLNMQRQKNATVRAM
ncbi:MAG: hypothetical protein IKS08_05035 [Alphaproteobacteria bacterium]|nr:hypothetical protein [Alphaproteobacteria bacterium]